MNPDEKACPRCAETVKAAALVCRFCGHEFGGTYQPSRSEKRQAETKRAAVTERPKSSAGQAVGIGCLAFLGLAVFGSLVGGGPSNTTASDTETDNLVALAENVAADLETNGAAAQESTPDWSVSTEQDEMRGKSVHYAAVTSDNEAHFDFPYNGGSRLTMTVRRHPRYGDDVVFQISKGQFVCGIDSCSGTINYGNGSERISLNESADYDSETLFAASASGVIRKLKGAEKVIVELPFYQEGNRQFTFKTRGLEWPPKG